jgi:hypothetical protein
MTSHRFHAGRVRRILCLLLAATMAAAPPASAWAQTNAAAMSVRQRVEGLESAPSPEGPGSAPPQTQPQPGQAISPELTPGKIDTRYVPQNACLVIALRPAQILASPVGHTMPAELVSALAGFEPAEMEEVIAFGDVMPGPGYGVTFKFKNPIRAASIPVERRNHVQLAELAGKKYLRSAAPMMYSLYGPNNRTLVAATEPALQQLVQTREQPKSGPMIERLNAVAPNSDLYLGIDIARLRPFIQMALPQAAAKTPPQFKELLELPNLIAQAELTVNVSNPGPTSLVLHCNDDAAAQKLETIMQQMRQRFDGADQSEQPAANTPAAQAAARYFQRLMQPFQPQRSGADITVFNLDGQNPAHQQLVSFGVTFVSLGAAAGIQAAQQAGMQAQGARNAGGPSAAGAPGQFGPPGQPGAPETTPPQ